MHIKQTHQSHHQYASSDRQKLTTNTFSHNKITTLTISQITSTRGKIQPHPRTSTSV